MTAEILFQTPHLDVRQYATKRGFAKYRARYLCLLTTHVEFVLRNTVYCIGRSTYLRAIVELE
jgi:predicted lipase